MVERAKSRKGVGQKPKCRSRCFLTKIKMKTLKQISNQISNENLIPSEIESLLKKEFDWINFEEQMPELGTIVFTKRKIAISGKLFKTVISHGQCVMNKFTNKPWINDFDFIGGYDVFWKPVDYI